MLHHFSGSFTSTCQTTFHLYQRPTDGRSNPSEATVMAAIFCIARITPKGTGKSTFMWLLNQGEKPKPSNSDGTVEILHLRNYVDSIGLTGWNIDELVKLLVLLIYDGIPRDLILFGNDRIDVPLTNLGLLGINNPMLVLMFGDFWQKYEPRHGQTQTIHLAEDERGVRRVEPEEDLDS
ncbi:hypothetical protein BV898_19453 [Hypsibius exemplaris]|uniref:Uncharacterized protein n=1 Tax=Hypsibius exemplaris TaxID=2072580 RepID=A0A9X6RP56_HYPEX|nr:hypothetical protein BV898_19453 [Hypsibius exemplaris]